MSKLTVITTATLLILAGPAICAGQEYRENGNEIVSAYNEIASSDEPVAVWKKDIHFAVLSTTEVKPEWISLIAESFSEVKNDLPVSLGFSSSATNFGIVFVADNDQGIRRYDPMLRLIFGSVSNAEKFKNSVLGRDRFCVNATVSVENAIDYHLVWIQLQTPNPRTSVENCIRRSVLTGIGLGKHDTSARSIFNPSLDLQDYSNLDRSLVKEFFAARIPGGVSKEFAAEKLAERIANGVVK